MTRRAGPETRRPHRERSIPPHLCFRRTRRIRPPPGQARPRSCSSRTGRPYLRTERQRAGNVLGSSTLSTAERLLPPAPPSVSTAPPSVDLSPHIGAKREMVAAVTDRGGRSPRPRPATRCPPHGCGRARRRSGTSSATAAAWSCRRRSAPCRLPLAHRLPTLDVPDEVGVGLTWRSLRFGLLPLRLVGAS